MKKSLLSILTMLFGVSAPMVAQSSSDDYIPLVVEGAKWECDFGIFHHDIRPDWVIPYTIEIKGDTIIDDTKYKCCVYTFEESTWAWEEYSIHSPADTLTLAFMREDVENKKVYVRFNEKQFHNVYNHFFEYRADETYFYNDLLLYDFANINNTEQNWRKNTFSDVNTSKITIDGIERNCYAIGNNRDEGYIIEGIGYDGYGCHMNAGDLMCQFPALVTGTDELPIFKSLKNAEGKTIYTTGDAAKVFNGVVCIGVDNNATEVARYDIYGRKLSQPTTGINIIKMSDGSTRKVIVK